MIFKINSIQGENSIQIIYSIQINYLYLLINCLLIVFTHYFLINYYYGSN